MQLEAGLQKSARRCTPSTLCLELKHLVLACLLSLLSFVLALLLLVLQILVRPRSKSLGGASVASVGRELFKGLSGLSLRGRVETNFDALVFQGCEESVDAVGTAVADWLSKNVEYKRRSATRSSQVRAFLPLKRLMHVKSRLDGMRGSLVCPKGRVGHIPRLRSFRCGNQSCCQIILPELFRLSSTASAAADCHARSRYSSREEFISSCLGVPT
jgi:hypothetical protein